VFLEKIQKGEIVPLEISVDENNYGQWIFVNVHQGFYVSLFGYKNMSESYVDTDGFKYEISNTHQSPPIPYETCKKIIIDFKKKVDEEIKTQEPPSEYASKRNGLFEILADAGDEDGAYSELEDIGLL